MHRVIDAVLALLDLGLGRAADADDGNATRQLRQALLQFLLVVIRGRLLDLRAQLGAASRNVRLLAGSVDYRRAVLVDTHLLCRAEHVERHAFQLDAEILADNLAAGEDSKVLEHGFAAVAKARRLDRRYLEPAAQLVDDERRQRLALDVLSHDQQRIAALNNGFEEREDRLESRQLLLEQQDVRVFELAQHLRRVGDEICREIAAVELHALDNVELGFEAGRLFDRNDTLVADLVHRLRDHLADFAVIIGRNRADLGYLVVS